MSNEDYPPCEHGEPAPTSWDVWPRYVAEGRFELVPEPFIDDLGRFILPTGWPENEGESTVVRFDGLVTPKL
jgi:hypothetical protein